MITYAQNFEDVMLARLFAGKPAGFYVDIGAWDPTRHSVTRHFYDLGWRGINVEPIRRQLALFRAERPRDVNLEVAVSDRRGTLRFCECTDLSSLSTLDAERARALEADGHDVAAYDVEVVTLADVLQRCPREVDFLKIDVEGHEERVLAGPEWGDVRPRVLVIEATRPALALADWDHPEAIENWHAWEPGLFGRGYVFAWYDGLSRFYLREEDAGLKRRLVLPPGVHDDIQPYDVVRLRASLREVEADRAAKAAVVERLAGEAADLAADRDDKALVNERLEHTLRAVEADRDDKALVNERLEHTLRAVEADRDEKALVIERLEHASRDVEADRDEKALVIERLERALGDIEADRGALRAANFAMTAELAGVEADRAAKAATVDRLTAELDAVTRDRHQLAATNARIEREWIAQRDASEALARDRDGKAARIAELESAQEAAAAARLALERARDDLADRAEALRAELTAARARQEEQQQSIAGWIDAYRVLRGKHDARQEVIHEAAARELERKATLRGVPDALFYAYRKHRVPGYVEAVPAREPAEGLRVAVDALEIVFGVSGGVETYMKMLVAALLGSGHAVTLVCLPDQIDPLQSSFADRVGYLVVQASPAMRAAVRIAKARRHSGGRVTARHAMTSFSRLAEDAGVQLLHSPVQIFSALDFQVPAVLNLHDLQHLHFPENFRPSDIAARNHLYGLSAALADAVVVSSDFVRDDLIRQMRVPASKVFTVPVTCDPRVPEGLATFGVEQARARYALPERYAIYPAQFWPHKNHVRLVEALRIVLDRRPESKLRLVFTGYRGHTGWPAVAETIERLRLGSAVLCLDHVPVEHLAALYRGSLFCVMPSTFEASSYPVIEAQLLGVPAMCSNVTSLPELMRDGAGLLFDPGSAEDIAQQMIRWLDDPADRAAHAQRGQARARVAHDPARYAAGIAAVYRYALESFRGK